jgi:hypothetical protein
MQLESVDSFASNFRTSVMPRVYTACFSSYSRLLYRSGIKLYAENYRIAD